MTQAQLKAQLKARQGRRGSVVRPGGDGGLGLSGGATLGRAFDC